MEEIAELDKKLEPVCCSELLLPQMLSVKLKSASAITMKHIFDARDIKWNLFYMIGEIAQARGHCIVIGQSSGRVYAMLHSDNFELTSPKDM